jgi:hypothetical protein
MSGKRESSSTRSKLLDMLHGSENTLEKPVRGLLPE